MKTTAEIRTLFLDFFKSKQHQIVASSALIPENDPSLLFTNAGMNQFKDVFLGLDKRDYLRATTAQRCVRAGGKHNDLENVGYTARHHTFFEMLGNFSFGDYFKKEAIHFAWELLTSPAWLNLPQEKLWVTVYITDDEAYKIWNEEIGIPAERIIRIGDKGAPYESDNFWQMGETGPCGPCSEIFYDHGEAVWGGPPGSPEEDGDRYIEIWNLVFMQFNRLSDGVLVNLPKPSVDTGMGLERVSAVLQHVYSNYGIDLFKILIAKVAEITGEKDLNNQSLRVIADHIRSCSYLIADDVIPSNEGRGYVLRRIIRRAVRHGYLLGVKQAFFYKLVGTLIQVMDAAGEILRNKQAEIEKTLRLEEEQFARTLERGLLLLDDALNQVKNNQLAGNVAFKLYDTYGFPYDLTADICRERNISIDEAGFNHEMEKQRKRAQEHSHFNINYAEIIDIDESTAFEGYLKDKSSSTITALIQENKLVDSISAGESAIVILDKSPFYAESGGQIGDKGILQERDFSFTVEDTQKISHAFGHMGTLTEGRLHVGMAVDAIVDSQRRQKISLNHSATHLLHAALRQVLGKHVTQKGSLVSENILRFDFSQPEAITIEQLNQIEKIVNQQIRNNLMIETNVMPLEEAKQKGAMALFGEKYASEVRVLSMGEFSIELCGGIHAKRTGDIGLFKIISEGGIAAGIRRIEAITAENAINWLHNQQTLLTDSAKLLKTEISAMPTKIEQLQHKIKRAEKELQQIKQENAAQAGTEIIKSTIIINDVKVIIRQIDGIELKSLRVMVGDFKNELGSAIIALASILDDKVNLVVGVTKDLTHQIQANELANVMAQEVGGKGGGRADMAMAGGSEIASTNKSLIIAKQWLENKLSKR